MIYDKLTDHLNSDFDILKNMKCTSYLDNLEDCTCDEPNHERGKTVVIIIPHL